MTDNLLAKEGRVLRRPPRLLVFGEGGTGKTTFAASAPSPLFIAAEDGQYVLDKDGKELEVATVRVHSYSEVFGVLSNWNPKYKTVVFDTLDEMEKLVCEEILKERGKKSMEDEAYGALYKHLGEKFKRLLVALESLQAKHNVTVIFLAHTQRRDIVNPDGPDYTLTDIKLFQGKQPSTRPGDDIHQWVDDFMYATVERMVKNDKSVSTDSRVLKTQPGHGYRAKNRHGLPPVLPLDWAEYSVYLKSLREYKEEVAELVEVLGNPEAVIEKLSKLSTDRTEWAAAVKALKDMKDD